MKFVIEVFAEFMTVPLTLAPAIVTFEPSFIIPFAEQVVQLEVRTLKFQADASAASNDLQVQTTIALNYQSGKHNLSTAWAGLCRQDNPTNYPRIS